MMKAYQDKPCCEKCGNRVATHNKKGLCKSCQKARSSCSCGCGRSAGKSRDGLSPECAAAARRERWRRKNPTFKEMVEMGDEELSEVGRQLYRLRAERKANLEGA